MIIRPARPEDQQQLADFPCSAGSSYSQTVQNFINYQAWDWSQEWADNHLWVLVDEDKRVLAVIAFEIDDGSQDLDEDDDDAYEPDEIVWHVNVLGVHAEHWIQGYATILFQNALNYMSDLSPNGRAYWRVHFLNVASQRLSSRVGGKVVDRFRFVVEYEVHFS